MALSASLRGAAAGLRRTTLMPSLAGRTTQRTFARPFACKVGDTVPDVMLDRGFPAEKFSFKELCAGKKVVLVGLPGAFTPTCSTKQIPGYLAKADQLKAKGVDAVYVIAVNDSAVMKAWEKDQKTEGSIVTLYADARSELSKALGVVLDDSRIVALLGNPRCQRFSMFIDNGVIKVINVAAAEDDPSGDLRPEISFADKMLSDI